MFFSSSFQQFPDQIVGFVPRKHVSTSSGIYSYGGFELQTPGPGNGDQYSMVLIGASFFNSKYLDLFQRQPAAVHALIDETQNCDDIAMNFIVTKHTGKSSGIFVKPINMVNLEKETNGYSGMWHRAEHFLQRSYCINKLVNIYDGMPLKYSNIMISQFGFPYANHKSKMWTGNKQKQTRILLGFWVASPCCVFLVFKQHHEHLSSPQVSTIEKQNKTRNICSTSSM